MKRVPLNTHHFWMNEALQLADLAAESGDVPIGAIVVNEKGLPLARTFNTKEEKKLAHHHAEILAMIEAAESIDDWRLEGCTLYTTLEPCPMCITTMLHYRIKEVVFGAYDMKGGAISLGLNLHRHPRLNHSLDVIGGILAVESQKRLQAFFKQLRN